MKLASLLILALTVTISHAQGADWEYPTGGPTGTSEKSAGRTGNFHCYRIITKDSPEKVVLWYAKQLELRKDHSLVEKAKAGFNKLERLNQLSYMVLWDTESEEWGAIIYGTVSPEIAHIHFFVRPENKSEKDVAISIAKTAKGTAVSVIRSVPSEARKNVAKAK